MNMQLKDSYKFGTLYTFKEAGVGGGSKKFLLISPNLQKYFVSDGLHGDDQGYGGIGPIGRR